MGIPPAYNVVALFECIISEDSLTRKKYIFPNIAIMVITLIVIVFTIFVSGTCGFWLP